MMIHSPAPIGAIPPPDGDKSTASRRPGGFAALLSQSQAPAKLPAAPAASPAASAAASSARSRAACPAAPPATPPRQTETNARAARADDTAAPEARTAAKPRPGHRAQARHHDETTPTEAHAAQASPDPQPGDATVDAQREAGSAEDREAATLADWLPTLRLPDAALPATAMTLALSPASATAQQPVAAPSLAAAPLDADGLALAANDGAGRKPAPAMPAGNEASAARGAADIASADSEGSSASAIGAARLAGQAVEFAPVRAETALAPGADTSFQRVDTGAVATGLSATHFAPGPNPARDLGVALPVMLRTPLTAPEFQQALGVQVSLLARDGVQHAELQLNPAEMGPVSVRIVLDGTQARVEFGADLAATRQAIETGLPELASALRDAGLTLSGGGVSQHSRGGRGDTGQASAPDPAGTRREPASYPDDALARPIRRMVSAGGVDLYA